MKHTYNITGMTCSGCVASVTEQLLSVDGVTAARVTLEGHKAVLTMEHHVPIKRLQRALSNSYTIAQDTPAQMEAPVQAWNEPSKWQQLRPLFLIFGYLFAAALLLHIRAWDTRAAMLDFMGLFYIVFSFFKFLDLKGFPASFRMYDPLAKVLPAYGWVYPFLELALGLCFLFRFQIPLALGATLVVLGLTTIGVTKTLLDKKSIRCACLGTVLKLPMTEATFIENAIMLVMASIMLTQYI